MVKSIKQYENNSTWINNIIKFIRSIHDDKTCEIRFIDLYGNGSYSIILSGENIYFDSRINGKKSFKAKLTPENLNEELNFGFCWANGGTVAFTVNSPNFDEMLNCSSSDKNVIDGGNINAQFIDIDAPKEVRKNELELKRWKKGVKEKILNFAHRPSIVVDTKNGYHVYWLLNEGKHSLFRQIQLQLIQYFNGDENCINESRVMRMPFFMHMKNPKKPYPVTTKIFQPQYKYSQEELMNVLPKLEEKVVKRVLQKTEKLATESISPERLNSVLQLILDKVDYVKVYDEKVTLHCCLPDHLDKNPSAWIDTEYMWFHCSGCGNHLPVRNLALELGWKDVVESLDKYDIDIESEINSIKDHCVNVKDIEHLTLNTDEKIMMNNIVKIIIEKFHSFDQQINEKHKQYVYDIVQLMYKANNEKPYLIPLDMGGGKSLIIKVFLIEMLKIKPYGAVVTLERSKDVKQLVEEINEGVCRQVAYPMYGFHEKECLQNVLDGTKHETCPARKTFKCPYLSNCRYWIQSEKQIEYPVLVITSQRLLQEAPKFDEYNFFSEQGEKRSRELLIIDEKPKLVYVKEVEFNTFKRQKNAILNALYWKAASDGSMAPINEFRKVVKQIAPLFNVSSIGRKIIKPIQNDFGFSKEFWNKFFRTYDYKQKAFEFPKFIESLMRNGGNREELNNGKVTITTSNYNLYSCFNNYKTIIFDGTADVDLEYQHENFHFLSFESLRTYENLTFYQCNLVSSSKTSMKSESKLEAFCEEVIKIADENPSDKIYLPVFKENKPFVEDYLEKYIYSGKIMIAHYGSTKGSNSYKNCSIVILGGILHKGETYYIGKAQVLMELKGDSLAETTCSNFENVRRFNDTRLEIIKLMDMLVDYSQEIKRSSQRDNTKNVEGKIYIFHRDKILMELLKRKFPSSKVVEWLPANLINNSVFGKGNNKNVKAICKYIENSNKDEIYFEEILKATRMTKQQFSNTLKNKNVKAFLKANNYEIRREGRKKKIVRSAGS
ncbi:hypothetical protein LG296_13015 [Ureibacillus chungkukjangi]|uniref:hypothetical protein n=1 Tax=Ureibacillus chungkukjangi TaxID=1202712 RepID=UPI00384B9F79